MRARWLKRIEITSQISFSISVDRAGGVDHPDAIRLARGQLAVSEADRFVKLERLLFHPIDPGGGADPAHHAGARRLDIDIEEEGEIGPAFADRESIEVADHFLVEPARDALVNGGGIGEAIGDHDRPAIERRLDHFPNELAAARFKKQQLGFRSHGHALGGELEEVPNLFANRGPARFARHEEGNVGIR